MTRRCLLRLGAEHNLRAVGTKLNTLLHISQAINTCQSEVPAGCSPANPSPLDESSGKRAAASPPKETKKPRALPHNSLGRTFSPYGGRIATKRQRWASSSTENVGYPKINAVEPRSASAVDLEPFLKIPNEKCAYSPGTSIERLEEDVDPSPGSTCKEDAGEHTAALRKDRKRSRVMDRRRPSSGRVLKKREDKGRNRTFRSRLRAAVHPPTRHWKASKTPLVETLRHETQLDCPVNRIQIRSIRPKTMVCTPKPGTRQQGHLEWLLTKPRQQRRGGRGNESNP